MTISLTPRPLAIALLVSFTAGTVLGSTPLLALSTDPAATPVAAETKAAAKKETPAKATAEKSKTAAVTTPAKAVTPLDLIKTPETYLNTNVAFDGTFTSFSNLGLDYPNALRESKDYINVVIRRPDVDHHTIPLSELKLFLSRKNSEDIQDLESGDSIHVEGTVFSTALGDPWVDISQIKVMKKSKSDKTSCEATRSC